MWIHMSILIVIVISYCFFTCTSLGLSIGQKDTQSHNHQIINIHITQTKCCSITFRFQQFINKQVFLRFLPGFISHHISNTFFVLKYKNDPICFVSQLIKSDMEKRLFNIIPLQMMFFFCSFTTTHIQQQEKKGV